MKFASAHPLFRNPLLRGLLAAVLLLLAGMALAAPYHGSTFTYTQPDGEQFTVRLWGDEFFAYQETEDGYLIARDEKTGEFCYARVTGNGDIVSTGVRVGRPKPPGLKPKQRLTPAQAMEKGRARRDAKGVDENGQLNPEVRVKLFPKKGKGEKAKDGKTGNSGTQETTSPDANEQQESSSTGTNRYTPGEDNTVPSSTSGGDELAIQTVYAPSDPAVSQEPRGKPRGIKPV